MELALFGFECVGHAGRVWVVSRWTVETSFSCSAAFAMGDNRAMPNGVIYISASQIRHILVCSTVFVRVSVFLRSSESQHLFIYISSLIQNDNSDTHVLHRWTNGLPLIGLRCLGADSAMFSGS